MDLLMVGIGAVLGALLSWLKGYLSNYSNEKGRGRALMEDAALLEREKRQAALPYEAQFEAMRQEHAKETEKIRSENSRLLAEATAAFDAENHRRKHQYEAKLREYMLFMSKLDSFNGFASNLVGDELRSMLNAIFASDLAINAALVIEVNEKAGRMVEGLRKQEAELFSGINGLKLIAPEGTVRLIEDLQAAVTRSRLYFEESIAHFSGAEFRTSKAVPEKFTLANNVQRTDILEARAKLFTALRSDLEKL